MQGLPVLVLIGTKDPQIKTEALKTEIKKSFSNAEFHALGGAGHSIHYENKSEVMKRIVLFSRKLSASVSSNISVDPDTNFPPSRRENRMALFLELRRKLDPSVRPKWCFAI